MLHLLFFLSIFSASIATSTTKRSCKYLAFTWWDTSPQHFWRQSKSLSRDLKAMVTSRKISSFLFGQGVLYHINMKTLRSTSDLRASCIARHFLLLTLLIYSISRTRGKLWDSPILSQNLIYSLPLVGVGGTPPLALNTWRQYLKAFLTLLVFVFHKQCSKCPKSSISTPPSPPLPLHWDFYYLGFRIPGVRWTMNNNNWTYQHKVRNLQW